MGKEETHCFEKIYDIWEGGIVWEQEVGIQSCKSVLDSIAMM